MGIILFMKLFYILLFLFPIVIFCQNNGMEFSDDYIIHKILKEDTYHSLKLKYGLPKRKIIKYNPALKKCKFLSDCPEVREIKIIITEKNSFVRDFLNDTVRTEITLEEIDTLLDYTILDTLIQHDVDSLFFQRIDSIINIAIFLPFFSNTTDSIILNTPQKKLNYNRFLSKSRISLDFYSGILFSFKEFMSNYKIELNVNVFDTYDSIDSIKKTLTNNNLDSIDIIFGPLYQDNFDYLVNVLSNHNGIFVSPLQANSLSGDYHDNVYFLQSELDKKISYTSDYIFNKFLKHQTSNHTVSVFLRENEIEKKRLVSYSLKEWKDNVNYYIIEKPTISEEMTEKEINKISDIVFIPSADKTFVTDLISRLYALKDTNMIVFCNEKIRDFDLIEHSEKFYLNVHYVSEEKPLFEYKEFIKSFYKYFSVNPQNPYVYKGYRCGTYFLNLFLNNFIFSDEVEILGAYYKFILQENNAFRNEAFKLWKYDEYSIEEVFNFNENQ